MNIIHIQKVKAFAGSEKYIAEICGELMRKGNDCLFICVLQSKHKQQTLPFLKYLSEMKVPYVVITYRYLWIPLVVYKIKKILQERQAKLVHSHLIHADLWLSIVKQFFIPKLNLITTIHGYDESFQFKHGFNSKRVEINLYFLLSKYCSRFVDQYIFVSGALHQFYLNSGILRKQKCKVIHHGYDYPENITDQSFVSSEIIKILVPGRVVPYKGQDLVMKIIPSILNEHPNVQFHFAGDIQSKFGENLKNSLKFESGNNVKFLGHVSNLIQEYSRYDFVIIPARVEGFGLVVIEAMAMGRPIIAFDVPAINEIIDHDVDGILIKPFDLTSLTAAVKLLIEDYSLRLKFSNNSKIKYHQYFTKKQMLQDTLTMYL